MPARSRFSVRPTRLRDGLRVLARQCVILGKPKVPDLAFRLQSVRENLQTICRPRNRGKGTGSETHAQHPRTG